MHQYSQRPYPAVAKDSIIFADEGAASYWLFIAGFSVIIDLPIAGRLMGPDIFCLLGLLSYSISGRTQTVGRDVRRTLILMTLWFCGAFITDVVRHTPFEDIMRGWSKIFFFGAVLLYLAITTKVRLYPALSFITGLYIGFLFKILTSDVYGFQAEPWKFGFGPIITFLAIALVTNKRIYSLIRIPGQISLLLALGAANLMGNSRSVFGMLIAIAAIVMTATVVDQKLRGRRLSLWIFVAFLAGGLLLYQGIAFAYGYLAQHGTLGEAALEKYNYQEQLGLGLLLGGRVESLASTQAILDSPIIGHGSWARDIKYKIILLQELVSRGMPITRDTVPNDDLIPSHSFLLGAWVEAGILGAVFWGYMMLVSIGSLYAVFNISARWRPLVAFIAINMLWNVMFSPFGAEQRFYVPGQLLIIFWAIRSVSVGPIKRSVRRFAARGKTTQ